MKISASDDQYHLVVSAFNLQSADDNSQIKKAAAYGFCLKKAFMDDVKMETIERLPPPRRLRIFSLVLDDREVMNGLFSGARRAFW